MTHPSTSRTWCAIFILLLVGSRLVGQQPVKRIVYSKEPATIKQTAWQDEIQEMIPIVPGGIRQPVANQPTEAAMLEPGEQHVLTLQRPKTDNMTVGGTKDKIELNAVDAELSALLNLIAEAHDINLVLGPDVTGPITVSISGASLDEALTAILSVGGFTCYKNGSLRYVTKLNPELKLDPRVQGKSVEVFPLNYVAAADVEPVVKGLLSTVGSAFKSESLQTDQARTQETLVVDDIPSSIERIAKYLREVDRPPLQVLIEAHVMQVTLDDSLRHGVNLQALSNLSGANINFKTTGLADDGASPSAVLGIDGTDLKSVVELIRTYSDAQTLASPKVLVVNRQEAKIQIGSQLGYYVTTTTETGTFQSVEFLNTGVVLKVHPIISDRGEILMTVTPEVSGGRINALGLPEEETTEVTSTILLPDGGGVVIGGLIKENNQDDHSMIPLIGRIPKIGAFFRRHGQSSRREEIIIALVTHIVPNTYDVRPHESMEMTRAVPGYAQEALGQTRIVEPRSHRRVLDLRHPPAQYATEN